MAVAAKGAGAQADSIMAPDRMKPLLALSKREPVQAAIGLTSDGEGIILLDKKAKPKKVASMLKANAAKAKIQLNTASLRFGRAEVDTDYDPGMVRFFINKDAPGNMRIKLVEVVKRIPYQKVELNVDLSLEDEPEDDTAAAAANVPDAPGLSSELGSLARQLQSLGDVQLKARLVRFATDANAAIKANDLSNAAGLIASLRDELDAARTTAGAPPASTPAALTAELMTLARRIPEVAGTDPTVRANLAQLAAGANGAIKANNLMEAANLVAQLRGAISAPGSAPAATGAPTTAIWNEAKETVDQQLNALYSLLKKAGLPAFDAITQEIEEVMSGFRAGLISKLMTYDRASGADRDTARAEALTAVRDYQTRIPSDKRVIAADTNPFGVPITIRAVLGAALDKLNGQLASV